MRLEAHTVRDAGPLGDLATVPTLVMPVVEHRWLRTAIALSTDAGVAEAGPVMDVNADVLTVTWPDAVVTSVPLTTRFSLQLRDAADKTESPHGS